LKGGNVKMAKQLKIEKAGKMVIFWAVSIVLILTAINYFFPSSGTLRYVSPVFVIGGAFFVFAEAGYFKAFKKKDPIRIIGSVVAIIAILGVLMELIPQLPSIGFITAIQGWISVLLAIFFFVEGFR